MSKITLWLSASAFALVAALLLPASDMFAHHLVTGASAASPQSRSGAEYRIKVKDVLDIHVEGAADGCCVEVDERGMIQVAFMDDDVRAEGKTPDELASELADKMKGLLKNPKVYVRVLPR
jgi:protein involved in polysaccharide export with SLBB domain